MDTQKIGLGTAAIGRPQYINIKNKATEAFTFNAFKAKGNQVLETAYQQGIRYFDTAPGYGLAEQLVFDWVRDKNDDSIEVATKWGYAYVADFDPNAIIHELKDHSINQLVKQWEVSKKLLPYLSTLQIHSATFDTRLFKQIQNIRQICFAFGNFSRFQTIKLVWKHQPFFALVDMIIGFEVDRILAWLIPGTGNTNITGGI